MNNWKRFLAFSLVIAGVSGKIAFAQKAQPAAENLPNMGQQITPTAPPNTRFEPLNPGLPGYPEYTAGQAVTTVISPDHGTLLVLTSGFNLLNATSGANQGTQVNADSTEYVFVYDISSGNPRKTQVLQVPNTYQGIVFDPSGKTFYVPGGMDDNLHIYDLSGSGWSERAGSPLALGHNKPSCVQLGCANGLLSPPEAAGVAISADGSTLVVANYYNDSISILTNSTAGWTKTSELDLRPGKIDPTKQGVPGGEYPLWVVMKGNSTAYVSSLRDREIDVINVTGSPSVSTRIKLKGQPNKMVLNASQALLYVAQDFTDSVAVIDTASNKIVTDIPAGPPARLLNGETANLTGNNTNSVTLSPDEQTLYVTNGNTNNVAVIDISGKPQVIGLIPTGWYPNSVSLSGDGKQMYVVNGKSPTGPNPGLCYGFVVPFPAKPAPACGGSNEYNLQRIKAGLQSFPVPGRAELERLTAQVAVNNHFGRKIPIADRIKMDAVRAKIQHVIFIVKENRTYDQVLGDLEVGNGDPDLTEFGAATTPNQHNLARQFVTLDSFYDRSEVSMDGWPWTFSARAPDVVEKQTSVNYANRGLSNDSGGLVRDINVGVGALPARLKANPLTPNDPDLLPGAAGPSAPDGPDNELNTGYIWDAALRAGLSVRNYGYFVDIIRENLTGTALAPYGFPLLTDPASSNTVVAYPANPALAPYTDPYFRGFDNSFPDYYRFTEWQREFDTTYANGGLPSLSFVEFMHDHTGNFGTAISGVNTPELQVADNDYAVGLLVQKIANSQYKDNTLIFVIEDDSQDGGDHVDSHRSIAFIAGPYVKQGAVVSTAYNTVDFVRTIEEVLGLPPLNLNDALAVPMADVFDLNQTDWTFTATPSPLLSNTTLPITFPTALKSFPRPTHDAAYWAKATAGMDFSAQDRIDFSRYNHILWEGLMGSTPYPAKSSGKDLSRNRASLLARYRKAKQADTRQQ